LPAEDGSGLDRRLGADDLEQLDQLPAHVAELVRADWALGDRPELEPLRCGPGRTCWVRGHWSTKNRRYSTTSTVLRRGRVDLLRVIAFRARVWRPATHKADLDGLRIHELRHGDPS
jgi:hypothetical protein